MRVVYALLFLLVPIAAQAATIEIGTALGSLEPYVNSIISALIAAMVGWVLYLVKNKLNISIDDSMRDALQTWLTRQASSLVQQGSVKVEGLKVNVESQALADAANLGLKEIPDALNHFGLTPDKLQEMITDKLPHVPSVAAVAKA